MYADTCSFESTPWSQDMQNRSGERVAGISKWSKTAEYMWAGSFITSTALRPHAVDKQLRARPLPAPHAFDRWTMGNLASSFPCFLTSRCSGCCCIPGCAYADLVIFPSAPPHTSLCPDALSCSSESSCPTPAALLGQYRCLQPLILHHELEVAEPHEGC